MLFFPKKYLLYVDIPISTNVFWLLFTLDIIIMVYIIKRLRWFWLKFIINLWCFFQCAMAVSIWIRFYLISWSFFFVVVIRKISCDLPIKHRKQNDINNFRRQMERDHIYYIRWHGHHRYRHWNLFAFWNALLFLKWEYWFEKKNGISFFSFLHQSHRECEHFFLWAEQKQRQSALFKWDGVHTSHEVKKWMRMKCLVVRSYISQI